MKNKNIPVKIGHIPIKVKNIHTAIKDFEKLGFALTLGSKHNAFMYFKDGSFLEIFDTDLGAFNILAKILLEIACLSGKNYWTKARRYWFNRPEGFASYSLDSVPTANFEENICKIRENRLDLSNPIEFPRTRAADGVKLTWHLSFASNAYILPFFTLCMCDNEPKLPVPEDNLIHINGVVGIKEIFVNTIQWDSTLKSYKAIYGQEPEIKNKDRHKMCTFKAHTSFVHLVEGDFDGIDKVVLVGSENSTEGYLDLRLTHGAKIKIVK